MWVSVPRHALSAIIHPSPPEEKPRESFYMCLGGPPGSVCTGAETLPLTGILSPDRPSRNKSLHRLSRPSQILDQGNVSIS